MPARSVKSLVDLWLQSEMAEGHDTQAAFARLNAAVGKRYDYRRAWEWRTSRRQIPSPARRYMLRASLPYALKCVGVKLSDERLNELAEMLR
jgi:hypothetical protein